MSAAAAMLPLPRRLPVGAEACAGGAHFRVWAPAAGAVELVLEAADATRARLPCPDDPASFEARKLDPRERAECGHVEVLALHRDLLQLRREDPTLRRAREAGCDGAVLDSEAFVVRFAGGTPAGDLLLLVNLGRDLDRDAIAEPLLAPPCGLAWALRWSSEDPRYGGSGVPGFDERRGWHLPAHSATLLAAARCIEEDRA